jgi:hypothetical protein
MKDYLNINIPIFNNIEGHPFVVGPQGPYTTKEEALANLIEFYGSTEDIPLGQEVIIHDNDKLQKYYWNKVLKPCILDVGDGFEVTNDGILNGSISTITWNANSNLNDYIEPQTINISGYRLSDKDNMPIASIGEDVSISAKLIVTKSPEGSTTYRHIIGQTLLLSNAQGHDTKIYTRSGNRTSYDGGITYTVAWGAWSVAQTMKETSIITTYDNLIDNGLYSGVYTNPNTNFFETFILVVINDYYIVSELSKKAPGVNRHIAQLKYSVNSFTGEVTFLYRLGIGDSNLNWSDWTNLSSTLDLNALETDVSVLKSKMSILYTITLSTLSNKNAKIGTTVSHTINWTVTVNGTVVEPVQQTVTITQSDKNPIVVNVPVGTYNYTCTNLSKDTTILLDVDGIERKAYVKFYNPSYYGLVDEDFQPTAENIEKLAEQTNYGTKALSPSKITTTANKKICYAYPKQLGTLTRIWDGESNWIEGFDLIDSVTIHKELYYVYLKKNATNMSGITYTYS